MKALSTLAFGAFALMTANFATVAPAAANDLGVYAGSNGFAIEIRHNDRYGYNHRRCWDRWYRYHHPYRCGHYRGYYGHHYPGYYGRRHHRHNDWRWRHRDRHDGWRDRDRRRHRDRDRDRW